MQVFTLSLRPSFFTAIWSLSLFSLVVALTTTTTTPPRKHLAGPPDEFSLHQLPPPSTGALSSTSALIPIQFETMKEGEVKEPLIWQKALPVDSDTLFTISFISPFSDDLSLTLKDPDGLDVDLSNASPGTFPIGDGGTEIPVTNFIITKPKPGRYTVTIEPKTNNIQLKRKLSEPTNDGYLIWFNESPFILFTHLNSYSLEIGEKVGLVSRVSHSTSNNFSGSSLPSALTGLRVSAELVMHLPDDSEIHESMQEENADGIFSASIRASQSGQHRTQALFYGVLPNNREFVRSTQHLMTIVPSLSLSGTARAVKSSVDNRILVKLGVHGPDTLSTFRAYSEVWGVNDLNEEVPVCWIGGLTNIDANSELELELDLNWLAMANAKLPLTLRSVTVQNIDTAAPVALVATIPLYVPRLVALHINNVKRKMDVPTQITEEMRNGIRPPEYKESKLNEANATKAGNLVLLHGYCSSDNPFQILARQDFTNGHYFLNPKASISHDQFAQLVHKWAANLGKYAGIGHSQGGCVLVHLQNYYWSGLDFPSTAGNRLIQTVGSPYRGCGAAGTAASFAKLFGIGCGRNDDLTRDGATLWLAGITLETRKKAYYFTTTYQLNRALGDWCNLPMNAVLAWPNDGTAELDYAQLPGGTNMGNTEKWCHISNMKYPNQIGDHSRNINMNANAARL